MVFGLARTSSSHTRLSPLVVNHTLPSAYQRPSPPLNEVPLPIVAVQVTVDPLTTAASRTPLDRSPHVVGRNRRILPEVASSVRYTIWPTGSQVAASWLNEPIAECATAGSTPSGSHSQTRPEVPFSSHESHVPHGVEPPAQLRVVPDRIWYAELIEASALNCSALAPPAPDASSLFEV